MTNYLCHPEKNFVKGEHFTKQKLPANIGQTDATKQCMARANGKDFFVHQHTYQKAHHKTSESVLTLERALKREERFS